MFYLGLVETELKPPPWRKARSAHAMYTIIQNTIYLVNFFFFQNEQNMDTKHGHLRKYKDEEVVYKIIK